MDGSDRKSNFSPPISNNRRPLIPKGVDENGRIYKENNRQNRKNRFGPDLSRKKVLAETNDSLDNQQKTPNLESKSVQKEANFDPNSSGEIGGSSSPYDPSTNYLSPRPKFLRYNPKRHREIMLRKEKEGEIDSELPNSDLDSVNSCGSLPQLESGEVNESDDEFEEEEDDRNWGFRGALRSTLQVLIVLAVLVFFTSYIVSMNSPTPSPVVQAVVDLRNGYRFLQDHVYGYMNQNLGLFGVMEDKRVLDFENEESSIESTEVEVENDVEEGEVNLFVEGETREEEEDEEIQDYSNSETAEKVEEEEDKFTEWEEEMEEVLDLDVSEVSDVNNSEKLGTVSVSVVVMEAKPMIFGGEISIENSTGLIKGFAEHMEFESLQKAVIGLLAVLTSVIAPVLLVLKFSKSRNGVAEPHFEARVPDLEEKPTESAANVLVSKPCIDLMEETLKEKRESERFYRSLSNETRVTPIIELLGELEISEMSTSLRSCGLKNTRVTEAEISSKLAISSYHFDVKKTTAKKGIEGAKQSRGKNELTTGLRRSSRIRNRVTSP